MPALRPILNAVLRPLYGGVGCCLCLHRVIPEEMRSRFPDNRALEITPEMLRDVLEWVRARNLEPIPLDEVAERLHRPRGPKFISFILDDGYRDNLVEALPVFRRYEVPFAIAVTTGFLDGSVPIWWYELEEAIQGNSTLRLPRRGSHLELDCENHESKLAAFERASKCVRECSPAERVEMLTALRSNSTGAASRSPMLTWDELRALRTDPLVTICAHTVGHYPLGRLSLDEARAELAESKSRLERELGGKVRHLTYPFGGRNAVGAREFRLAAEVGFQTAYTTRVANLFPAHRDHLLSLPRLVLSGNWEPIRLLAAGDSGFQGARQNRLRRIVTE